MITGFNTDIEFDGKTYHVQTEDKGLSKPLILSLIYNGGTILASRRTPYDDLLEGGLDEKALTERLNKQHRTICAAIKAGRLDDLIRLSRKQPVAAKPAVVAEIPAVTADIPSVDIPSADIPSIDLPPIEAPAVEMENVLVVETPMVLDSLPAIPRPNAETARVDEPLVFEEDGDTGFDILNDAYAVIEEEVIVPDEAVEIVSEMVGLERPSNSRLTVELLGENSFRGGENKSVTFMICRGSERKVVKDAQIMVKILGSSFRPLIFHAKTDANGLAKVNIQFPTFSEGRAALLIRATSEGEEVELRRIVNSR